MAVVPGELTWLSDRLWCIVCTCCAGTCPTKCLAMETQYTAAMTARAEPYKVTVAGPKKKKPAPERTAKPAEKKE